MIRKFLSWLRLTPSPSPKERGGLRDAPRFLREPESAVEFAFAWGGKRFYCFADEYKMPAGRALVSKDVWEELEMRVDRAYLESFTKALEAAVNKGDLIKVAKLTGLLQDRMSHITNIDLLYKLAAVRYFAEDENPYSTDMVEVERKVAFWKSPTPSPSPKGRERGRSRWFYF